MLDLVQRLTNEEIAARLGTSLDGAKYHVSQILSRLGVSSREEAAGTALGGRHLYLWVLYTSVESTPRRSETDDCVFLIPRWDEPSSVHS